MFNKQVFDAHFSKAINRLARVEGMTKEIIKNLSREVLTAVHETGDISYVNKTIDVLTPVNKRVFVLYAKEHTGFVYDEKAKTFTNKNKKVYDGVKEYTLERLEDPHFNMWTWAEKNVEVEKKPLDLSKITAFIKSALKKADAEGIPQSEVVKAVFAGGVDVDSLLAVLSTMEGVELNVTEE